MKKSSGELNAAQERAVRHTEGPLLIIAGAGTGKTTVITQKIAHLIESGAAKPEEILALTFTEKAAEEMQSRVDELIQTGYSDLQISTFHAFCQRLLEEYGLDIGLPNRFSLLTDTDAWILLKERVFELPLSYYRPLGNPTRHIAELLRHFSKCKDELITPDAYLAYAEHASLDKDETGETEKSRRTELANIYHAYNQLLLDRGALDFGDLIAHSIRLLEQRPDILKKLHARFRFVLVDEFQDVNWAQYRLTQLLAGHGNLTVVGDDDQAIYAFRGASVSNILRFKEDFPSAAEVVLTDNYRSGQNILDMAYASIQHNNPDRLEAKLQIDKRLTAKSGTAGEVIHLKPHSSDDEVDEVVREIIRLKNEHSDASWDDMAILVRANSHAEPFLRALDMAQVPYEFLASSGLYRQPIVLDCLNFFTAVSDHLDSPAVYRLLRMPCTTISENDLQTVIYAAKKKSVSYYEALKRAREFHLSDGGIAAADRLVSLLHNGMKSARTDKPSIVLYRFLEESGYLAYLAHEEQNGAQRVIHQIYQLKQFFDMVRRFEEIIPDASVLQFTEHMENLLDAGSEGKMYQPSDTPDSVNVMTVHAAKGLEFRFVFVVNLVEERFPARRRGEGIEIPKELVREKLPEGDYHTEEERRLLYVAMTRAKERLYLTGAEDYGGSRKKKPSRFLVELGLAEAPTKKKSASAAVERITPPHAKRMEDPHGFVYDIPEKFSFSQVKAYETCPYQYKLAHILKIPTRGSASFSFGQSMHATMQKFYEKVQAMNNAKQVSLFGAPEAPRDVSRVIVPPLEELLAMYDASWQENWYESKRQREEYYKKGRDILNIFYASEDGRWTVPAALESWFKIHIGEYIVHGRIDRVDVLPDGTLEIIDYKTGKSKATLESSDKEQLLLYQIAAEALPEYRALGAPGKLTFLYVNDNIRTSFTGSGKELDALKEKLLETMSAIRGGDFAPMPGAFVCAHCDFRNLCEFRAG
jgi:DNA helicase-2/ATP-dependent DNA helicase PcrA